MAKKHNNSDSDSEGEKDYKPSLKKEESSEEEFSDDQEEEKPKASKKQKAAAAGEKRKRDDVQRNADGDQFFELSAKRRITVRAFSSGEASVDIREVYQDKNSGEMRPGKGICLPVAQWNKLKELLPDIQDAIDTLPSKKK